jgi:hypothetical protein
MSATAPIHPNPFRIVIVALQILSKVCQSFAV